MFKKISENVHLLFRDDSDKQRFFIEAGAHDGIASTNTLHLEMKYNWTGILVEPNPDTYKLKF